MLLIDINLDYIEDHTRIVKINLFGFCTKSHFTTKLPNILNMNKIRDEVIFTTGKGWSNRDCLLSIIKLYQTALQHLPLSEKERGHKNRYEHDAKDYEEIRHVSQKGQVDIHTEDTGN